MAKFDDEEEIFIPLDSTESRSFNLLRADNELFNDASHVVQKVVNVRRVNLKRGEDWEILEDGDVALVMKGTRFTNPEKQFLRSVEGMKFIIAEYKAGSKSVVKIKEKMKGRI